MAKQSDDDINYDNSENQSFDTSVYGPSTLKNQFLEKLRQNIRYISVGIVIVVLIIYKLLSSLFSPSVPAKNPAVGVQGQVSPATVNYAASTQINPKSAIIENSISQNRERILENTQAISRIESTVFALQAQVNSLNNALQDLTVRLEKPKVAKDTKHKKIASDIAVKKTRYYVQAIIPERAWLKKEDGTTITVSRGDEISGYGNVVMIDVNNSAVVMSDGSAITFHPNDR